MLSWLLVLSLYGASLNTKNSEYKPAVRTASEAAAKQTGIEADFGRIKQRSTDKAKLFAKDNGLQEAATVISFAAPVIIKKKIRVRTGNFLIQGSNSKAELLWTIGF